MKTKIEIKSVIGSVLFEHECDNNTIRKALEEAVSRGANLRGANLSDAYLSGANLSGAYLSDANLRDANLSDAYLSGANLRDANLRDANLRDANLSGAYLRDADLSGANLSDADLSGAKNAELAIAQTLIVPEGTFTAWKRCRNNTLVKLRIPEDAKRSNASGRKCRAERVEVLEIIDMNDRRIKPAEAVSSYKSSVVYRVGETVTCDKWNEDRWEECSGGIHFFITRIEAENYN